MTAASDDIAATPRALAGLRAIAECVRVLAMDGVEAAKSGHPGMPMGMADVAATLWGHALKFDAAAPAWPDRDRFVLSAGHGSMLLYGLLHLAGFPGMDANALRAFRQWGSLTPGHPEFGHSPGVEMTTGPLGQGFSAAVGMAMAEARLRAEFGPELVDHRIWVIASDGDLMEGVSHEAASLAGRLKLDRLCVLWDDNAISIDGDLALAETGDQLQRFGACGWSVKRVDGHDHAAIAAALDWSMNEDRPVLIACRTRIGRGAATKEGLAETHGKPLGAGEIAATKAGMGWVLPPFTASEAALSALREAGQRGAARHAAWQARLASSPQREKFRAWHDGNVTNIARQALSPVIDEALASAPAKATREHSGTCLAALVPALLNLLGGSADLTPSNNTRIAGMATFEPPGHHGNYVHYGVREHGMAAAMNGMALHGGLIPYGGTFFVFADYCRPAIRLAALMGLRVIHVMTHDSIGVGEDGPTHQPIEHLASLRAMPNLAVLRPADLVETAECWAIALENTRGPSILVLSRQKTPASRVVASDENLSARGAYEIRAAVGGEALVTIFASGTEVAIAIATHAILAAEGIPTRVVSVPSFGHFLRQSEDYRRAVIGHAPVRVAIEAAASFGWERFIGEEGLFIGLDHFGASAPAERLYEEFGLTAQQAAAKIRAAIRKRSA